MDTENLFSLGRTLAAPLFAETEYPWQIPQMLEDYIYKLGATLDKEKYAEINSGIWVAKNAKIDSRATLTPPLIIDEAAEIRTGAYLRGSVIVGKGSVVGNSSEIKCALLFDGVQLPHYNYVGNSVLGYRAHLGAGAIISNLKSDKSNVSVTLGGKKIDTGMRKLGAIVGDLVEVGCNSVLCPGTVIGRESTVYPLSRVRGYIPEKTIYKGEGNLTEKR